MSDTVSIWNRQRRFLIDTDQLANVVEAVLAACDEQGQEVAIQLVSDRTISQMNRTYRLRKGPTDVLSFAMRDGEFGDPSGTLLGDLVISLETVVRQCLEPFHDGRPQTGTPQKELALMTIHGLLHLMGVDHERSPEEAAEMIRRETELFERFWSRFPDVSPRGV